MTKLTYVVPAKPRKPFAKGEFVDVMDREGNRMDTVRVVRAGKKTVGTDCGRKWTQSGWWQSETAAYPFPWIRRSRRKIRATQSLTPEPARE